MKANEEEGGLEERPPYHSMKRTTRLSNVLSDRGDIAPDGTLSLIPISPAAAREAKEQLLGKRSRGVCRLCILPFSYCGPNNFYNDHTTPYYNIKCIPQQRGMIKYNLPKRLLRMMLLMQMLRI